ncbi:MAG: hypothetical protein WA960_16080 [Tunicatimonas sp.]
MQLREAATNDIPAIITLFQQAILQATVRDYNQRQREAWATEQKLAEITTDASIIARPFFTRHGYQTLAEQQNKIEEEVLINYRMRKIL